MFWCTVCVCLLTTVMSLKISQRQFGATCKDESKADGFFNSVKGNAPGNGQRVGEWRDMYPSWSFMYKDVSDTCMLKGNQLSSDEAGVQVVIDYNPLNAIHCCRPGESPKHSPNIFLADVAEHKINYTTIEYTVPEGSDHAEKNWFYDLAVPDSCLPGGARAPCPLLVSLHGMAWDHISHMALECSDCMNDMGVIALMLYDTEAVGHDNAGNFVINHAWDSFMWLGEEYVREVTQKVMLEYSASIDTKRVYLFGLSMGGAGALMDAITEPDIFNAAFVVSPTSVVRTSEDVASKAKKEWKPLYDKRKSASHLKKIYIYQGGDDNNGADIDWDLLPQTLENSGLNKDATYVEYRMFPELPHDCWLAAFEAIYEVAWKGD